MMSVTTKELLVEVDARIVEAEAVYQIRREQRDLFDAHRAQERRSLP